MNAQIICHAMECTQQAITIAWAPQWGTSVCLCGEHKEKMESGEVCVNITRAIADHKKSLAEFPGIVEGIMREYAETPK